jgi:hypothetical protein
LGETGEAQTQTRPAFGLRARTSAPPSRNVATPRLAPAPPAAAPILAAAQDSAPAGPAATSIDEELQAWKEARGSKVQMPWRQLALMASLCFGIASFVLPDSVNGDLDWLLWGLMAASAYVGFRKRREKRGS